MKVFVRGLAIEDYEDLHEAMLLSYENMDDDPWARRQVATLLRKFPDGQMAVEVNGKVVGCALSLLVDYSKYGDNHTYSEITATRPSPPTIRTGMSSTASTSSCIRNTAVCAWPGVFTMYARNCVNATTCAAWSPEDASRATSGMPPN